MPNRTLWLSLFCFAVLLPLLPSDSHGAFCALRDPINTIAKLFPEATTHRSIVKVVGEQERQAVSDRLPPNVLHFSELGQHTLYVAFENNEPLGYVHVRSEESEWGLVEVAWAMDTQLRVKDFRFQRCRSRSRKALEAESFRSQLRGLSFDRMQSLMSANGADVDRTKLAIPAGAEDLASVVLRCGLKTLLVTQLVWADDVARYATANRAIASFGSDQLSPLSVSPHELKPILERAFPNAITAMDPANAEVFGVYDQQAEPLGAIYRNTADLGGHSATIEWHVSPKNRVLRVSSLDGWPDQRTQALFEDVQGESFYLQRQCSDRTALMTKQAVLTTQLALASAER